MGEGRRENDDEEREWKPTAAKLETSPDQLTLIAFDSSGEVGQSCWGSPTPRTHTHQADKSHELLCQHGTWGWGREFGIVKPESSRQPRGLGAALPASRAPPHLVVPKNSFRGCFCEETHCRRGLRNPQPLLFLRLREKK